MKCGAGVYEPSRRSLAACVRCQRQGGWQEHRGETAAKQGGFPDAQAEGTVEGGD